MGCGASKPASKAPEPKEKKKTEAAVRLNTTELNLEEKGLTAMPSPLPPALINLNVSKNAICEISSDVGALSKLQVLDASENQLCVLTGEIGSCCELTELLLYKNLLKELPAAIGTLSKLKTLNMFNNKLRKLPNEIGELAGLEEVNFAGNKLMMIDSAAFANWKCVKVLPCLQEHLVHSNPSHPARLHAQILNLFDNNLVRLGSLEPLVALTELRLSGNNLEEMPLLGETLQLELLEVQKNRISVMSDEYFSKMPALKRLVVSDNKLSALSPSILGCSMLEQLQIQTNEIKSLPEGPWQPSLVTLFLQENTALADLPAGLTECSALRRCNVSKLPLTAEAKEIAEQLKTFCLSQKEGAFWDETGNKTMA